MNEALKNKVKSSTIICMNDGFPEDNAWQRRQMLNTSNREILSPMQYLPNEYVKSILLYNINPVVSSLSYLGADCEKKAIGVIIEIVLSTLISYVSERKIKLRSVFNQVISNFKFITVSLELVN